MRGNDSFTVEIRVEEAVNGRMGNKRKLQKERTVQYERFSLFMTRTGIEPVIPP